MENFEAGSPFLGKLNLKPALLAFCILLFATGMNSVALAGPTTVPGYEVTSTSYADYAGSPSDYSSDYHDIYSIQPNPISSDSTEAQYAYPGYPAFFADSNATASAEPNQVEISAFAEGITHDELDSTASSSADFFDSVIFVDPSKTGQTTDVTANLNLDESIGAAGGGYATSTVAIGLFEGNNLSNELGSVIDQDQAGVNDTLIQQTSGTFQITYGQEYIVELSAVDEASTGATNSLGSNGSVDISDPSIFFSDIGSGASIDSASGQNYAPPAAAPESSTEVSFGILAVLGGGALLFARRKQANA